MEVRKQLAQSRVSGTSAIKLFNIADLSDNPARVLIEQIVVCNTTGTDLDFSVYHDKDGTTYDETTALIFEETSCGASTVGVGHEKTLIYDVNIGIESISENIAVKSSLSKGFTYTLYGKLID